MRMSKNACPSCREKVTTRRSLRRDTKFDEMIATLYGDVGKIEGLVAEQDKAVIADKARKNAAAMAAAHSRQAINADETKKRPVDAATNAMAKKLKQEAGGDAILSFVLRKHPCEFNIRFPLLKEYIKCSSRVTIDHLCSFVADKQNNKSVGIRIVYHDANGEEIVVPKNFALDAVFRNYKNGNLHADLILHYRLQTAEDG